VYSIISNCTFRGNLSVNGSVGGGAAFFRNSSYSRLGTKVARIDNCLIESNTALNGGGGLFFNYWGIYDLRNCVIRGNVQSNYTNSASTGGGGIEHGYGASVQMWNCLVYNNYATGAGGGIYNMKGGVAAPLVMYNCTVVSNTTAQASAGGIGCRQTIDWITLCNTIVAFNKLDSIDAGTVIDVQSYSTSSFTNCCITSTNIGGSRNILNVGAGNITNNPSFVDFTGQDFRLVNNSPCVNRGLNQDWMTNGVNLDGLKRIRYGTVDMGAYELIYEGAIYQFH